VSGIPGSGKTRLRKTKYSGVEFVDIADLRDEEEEALLGSIKAYKERMYRLFDRIIAHRDAGDELLVVEGIFAPKSDSLKWLCDTCSYEKIGVRSVESLDTDIISAAENILNDYSSGRVDRPHTISRLELACAYHRRFV
jgi:hypothetical protein